MSCRQSSSLRPLPWLALFFLPALLLAAGLALTLPAPAARAATTRTVCSSGADYTTIQAAVSAAGPGDVIEICNGTYAESVNLSTMSTPGDITLRGSGTVVMAPTSGGASLYVMPLFPGSITLENLGFTSPNGTAVDFLEGLSGDLTVTGVSINNAGGRGINATVQGSVYISATSVYSSALSGLDLTVAQMLAITNSVFSYNGSLYGSPGLALDTSRGLACGTANAVSLSGVRAEYNWGLGILATTANGAVTFSSGAASHNNGNGLLWDNQDGCGAGFEFNGVNAESNGSDGIKLAGTARVINSTANGNGQNGIWLEPVYGGKAAASEAAPAGGNAGLGPGFPLQFVITNTTASNNRADGIHFIGADVATVQNVSANGNGKFGIYLPVHYYPMIGATSANTGGATWAEIEASLITSNSIGVVIEDVTEPVAAAGANSNPGATVNLHDSMVCSNTLGLVSAGYISETIRAQNNAWGDASGPLHPVRNPAGTGNPVLDFGDNFAGPNGYVDFFPWLFLWQSYAMPNPLIVGGENQFLTFLTNHIAALGPGPGNLNDAPPFTLTTSNGVVATEFGGGVSAPARVSDAWVISGTLIPDAAGPVTVTVSGPCGHEYTETYQAVMPQLAVSKTPALQAVLPGGTVTFTVAFTNTGDVPLQNVIVTDTLAPACSTTVASLSPGQSSSTTCTQGPVAADFTNQVIATANPLPLSPAAASADAPPEQMVVTATASALVDVVSPGLSVDKSVGTDANACAQPGTITVPANTQVYYCLRLTNSGDVTLTDHLISDPLLGVFNLPVAYTLAPGASLPITHSVIPALGPINVTAPITNVYAVTSTGVITEVGGVVVPTVGVSVASAAAVSVRTPSTALPPGDEPLINSKLYLPTLHK